MRRSSITSNATIILISILSSLLLLEAGLRVYSSLFFPKMMVLDDKLGWRHAADASKSFTNEFGETVTVVQNAYGHRDSHSLQSSPGSFRILALGDSFTEGVQVSEDELFTARLEHADSHVEVINAGVGGYGTVQEYLYLATKGLRFHPDLVLLMFYDNDLTDNGLSYYPGFGPRPYATLKNGSVQIVETLDSSDFKRYILPIPFQMALNSHSYFYYFLNSRIYQPMLAQRMREEQQADLRKIDTNTRYELFYNVLDKLNGLLKEQGVPLLLVLIPSREDVARGESQTAATIGEYCRANGIRCLSLLDRFQREAAGAKRLYFPVDIHWTKDGHNVAANEIFTYLRSSQATNLGLTTKSLRASH